MPQNRPENSLNLMAIGKLGAPRGVEGQLKVSSYSGEYDHIERLGKVMLSRPGGGADSGVYAISGKKRGAWGLSLSFEGYDSPELARKLTGMELLVPREEACPLSDGEWYAADLVGMSLVYEGRALAKVVAVLEGAADPLLESVVEGENRRVLVPFRKEFVGRVDANAKTLELLNSWIVE